MTSLALVVRQHSPTGDWQGILVAVAHGFRVGLYALIVALGIASILFQFAWAMTAVQLMGVLFIAYLGSSMIKEWIENALAKSGNSRGNPQTVELDYRF